jgi:hypothetical protein
MQTEKRKGKWNMMKRVEMEMEMEMEPELRDGCKSCCSDALHLHLHLHSQVSVNSHALQLQLHRQDSVKAAARP